MNEPESIGHRIIDMIIRQPMFRIDQPEPAIIVWNGNAADQLDALVASHTATLQQQLDAASERADSAAAEAAALDILITRVSDELDNQSKDGWNRAIAASNMIHRFRKQNGKDHV